MSTNTGLKTYTKKERNMYLTGLLGQNILYNVTNVLLVSYFLQNVLYIPSPPCRTVVPHNHNAHFRSLRYFNGS